MYKSFIILHSYKYCMFVWQWIFSDTWKTIDVNKNRFQGFQREMPGIPLLCSIYMHACMHAVRTSGQHFKRRHVVHTLSSSSSSSLRSTFRFACHQQQLTFEKWISMSNYDNKAFIFCVHRCVVIMLQDDLS